MKKAFFILITLLLALTLCAGAESYRTLQKGDAGDDVLQLKQRLYELGYFTTTKFTNVYNDATIERVKQFQKLNDMTETGIATPELQELLYSNECVNKKGVRLTPTPLPTATPTPVPAPTVIPTITPAPTKDPNQTPTPAPAPDTLYQPLQKGDNNAAVKRLKDRMQALGYFKAGASLSSDYNDVMEERVKDLQKANGLDETGIATPELQALIYSDKCVYTGTTPKPTATPKPPLPTTAPITAPYLPKLTDDGFLSSDADTAEWIYKNKEDGLWYYISPTLRIEIRRYEDPNEPLVWFETDVRVTGDTRLTSYLSSDIKKGYMTPTALARAYNAVLAINDDFYGYRKNAKITQGIIIRSENILSEKTYKNNKKAWPNLEIIALFEDGSMKTYLSGEYTAKEYMAMGVTDTFAFGPILVTNGELGEHVDDANYKTYYNYHEPRTALGVIEPNHYFILTCEGRQDDSRGASLRWMADKMLERNVQEGLNLDGGGTVGLVFLGEQLNRCGSGDNPNGDKARKVTSVIGFGVSDNVLQNVK